jgi:hypothetical protein
MDLREAKSINIISRNKSQQKILTNKFSCFLESNKISDTSFPIGAVKINTYVTFCLTSQTQSSSVGIATDYGLDDRVVGVRVPLNSRIFISS